MIEIPLQYGENGCQFGIMTTPDSEQNDAETPTVFIFLSAGLLHRAGPHRLHVRLARALAQTGTSSFRIDFSGIGESQPRSGVDYQQSVEADFQDILTVLDAQLGRVSVVLVGLCSGADNAIRLAAVSERVVGLILLDPVCEKSASFNKHALKFRLRALSTKLWDFSRYLPWLQRQLKRLFRSNEESEDEVDNLSIRDIPTSHQLRCALESIRDRDGRVISIFTEYALRYYNQLGQLKSVMEIDEYDSFCTEVFWPHAEHNYPIESHRRQLIDEIVSWAAQPMPRPSV